MYIYMGSWFDADGPAVPKLSFKYNTNLFIYKVLMVHSNTNGWNYAIFNESQNFTHKPIGVNECTLLN